jgi:D-3-phosphoglycerate dehydrogenase
VYEKLRPGTLLVEELAQHGIVADLPFGPDSTVLRHARISEDELISLATGYDGVIGVSGARFSRTVFESLPQLKFISKIGIGFDVIDIEAANDFGVKVTNTPSPTEINGVAEHAIALLLAAIKRLDYYTIDRMRAGGEIDTAVRARTLGGSTLGLIGYGRIARAMAHRLAAWDLEIVAYDIYPMSDTGSVRMVSLDELLTVSDFVSLHAPGSPGGRPVLDEETIGRLKPGVVIVNTARGGLIDQAALAAALASGHVSVAGLDVFSPDHPEPTDPLMLQNNLVVTPHTAANVIEVERDMELMAIDNLREMLAGNEPASLVTTRSTSKK